MKNKDAPLIILTGGAGFIGSAVLRVLNDSGCDNVLVVDHLGKDEKWKNLVGKRFADIIEPTALFDWLEGRENGVEAFIHLGANSSTVETDASALLENNYHYSCRLAEYALKHKKRFIYASSAATYGDGNAGFDDRHDLIGTLRPLNMYGYSKQLFDEWLQRNNALDKVVGLKYFNVFGPNEYHKGRMASAIYHLFPQAREQGVVKLFKSNDPERFADGGQMRDFIYIRDAARMTCAFLNNSACGIFNIGRGEPGTWNQVVNALFRAIDKEPNIHYIDMPDDLKGKYQNYTCADMTRTRQALGNMTQCMTIEDSVKDYVQNFLIPGRYW